jgi:2-oxoglutarate ferredoxin oxidoreductase subunit alpha
VRAARAEGLKAGLLRPITLNPFPQAQIAELARRVQALLVVEMSAGQMLRDVQGAAAGQTPVEFYGRMGGVVPFPDEVLAEIRRLCQGKFSTGEDPRQAWISRLGKSRN